MAGLFWYLLLPPGLTVFVYAILCGQDRSVPAVAAKGLVAAALTAQVKRFFCL